ncbi:MAG: glycosyltransferase family 4 protein [Calditrichia bacterium]
MILFIHKGFSTFVETDYKLLSDEYPVLDFYYNPRKGILYNILNQIALFGWLLKNIWEAKAVFIWFADYHSFFPVLFANLLKKKSYLVLGGYDVAYLPEINYGSFNNKIRAFFTRYSIRHSTLNLPVVDSVLDEALERVPDANIKVLYTAYKAENFFPDNKSKDRLILTVALVNDKLRMKLKGMDIFIEAARKIPEYRFMIIGMSEQLSSTLKDLPPNLTILGAVAHDSLLKYYQRAKIYAQFSMREGLPNTVCEAMLCECIPVGANVGGIPVAIDDAGFLMRERNIDAATKIIRLAMQTDDEIGKKARHRIIENFSLEKRKLGLMTLLQGLKR